jgi:hypothetical protein
MIERERTHPGHFGVPTRMTGEDGGAEDSGDGDEGDESKRGEFEHGKKE